MLSEIIFSYCSITKNTAKSPTLSELKLEVPAKLADEGMGCCSPCLEKFTSYIVQMNKTQEQLQHDDVIDPR